MLQENNVRKGFFEHGDFLAVRKALPEYLRGFVTFAYKVGWRFTEISTLTWAQVDLNQGIVRLEAGETKNTEGREVYLDEELKKVFIEQAARRVKAGKLGPYVFPNHDGTSRIKDIRGAWGAACIAAGFFRLEQDGKKTVKVPTRLFHDFRRTAVRNMVRAGIPERVAMMISGHKTRSVFDRYNIVSDADLRIAAAKQEAYLETQIGTISGTITDFRQKQGETGGR